MLQEATATVQITVSDVNDNDPQFSQDVYTFSVPENEGNFVVGPVSATDADRGSTLEYRLEYPSTFFSLDANTGTLRTIRPLDYETTKQHNFTVEVSDGPPSPRTGRALVIVNVLDRPDSVPVFPQRSYNADFEENRTGTLIRVNVSTMTPFDDTTIRPHRMTLLMAV